jgi:hydroxymethylbilane synthase
MAQAEWVSAALVAIHPGLVVSMVEVRTVGDRDLSSPVSVLTEVGAFVRAVQRTVVEGEADLAVHSCKDLPVEPPSVLTAFFPERAVPWDVLCGHDLDSLPTEARVGTGSPRRAAQLRLLRPGVDVEEIRGNVDTRLAKLLAGEYDAVVLAEAGLRRLGREKEIGHRFGVAEMVPAPGQGALAVEALNGSQAAEIARSIDHEPTRRAVEAERALLAHTRAGCRSALGAVASVDGPKIRLTGFVEDESGPRFGDAVGTDPEAVARELQSVLGL